MKDRIIQVMEHEGLAPSKFAEAIGIQRSAMSHILSGRNNPSLDVLMKILERFTYVDPDWLMFGKGGMMRSIYGSEPDLFSNVAENCTISRPVAENRVENGVETPVNYPQNTVIEKVVCQETPAKIVSKIMIFYSDNTFDTFVPEKTKKD